MLGLVIRTLQQKLPKWRHQAQAKVVKHSFEISQAEQEIYDINPALLCEETDCGNKDVIIANTKARIMTSLS